MSGDSMSFAVADPAPHPLLNIGFESAMDRRASSLCDVKTAAVFARDRSVFVIRFHPRAISSAPKTILPIDSAIHQNFREKSVAALNHK
jgi:hypothetical protein